MEMKTANIETVTAEKNKDTHAYGGNTVGRVFLLHQTMTKIYFYMCTLFSNLEAIHLMEIQVVKTQFHLVFQTDRREEKKMFYSILEIVFH